MLRVELLLLCVAVGCSAPDFKAQPSADAGGLDSSSGGASGSGGSSGAGSEDCTNGQDDDKDGLTDCADVDDCACLPQVLAGWKGPYLVTPTAADGDEPVACPQGAPTEVEVLGQLDAPAAKCPTCSCGSATGSCNKITLAYHFEPKCPDAGTPLFGNLSTSCQQTGFSGSGPKSISATVTPTGVTCPPVTTGNVAVPQPSLTQRRRVCSGSLGVCSSGHCMAAIPTGHRACVLGTTAQTCPTAYSVQEDLDTATIASDTRACTPCGCDVSSSSCANWKVLAGLACTDPGSVGTFGPTKLCLDWPTTAAAAKVDSFGTLAATCAPKGGDSVGMAQAEKMRLCCAS